MKGADSCGRRFHLGVMICCREIRTPASDRFYAQLCRTGGDLGLHVYLISPDRFFPGSPVQAGLAYDPERREWADGLFPPPDLIYDRILCRCNRRKTSRAAAASGPFRENGKRIVIPHLSGSLGGKWSVYKTLRREPSLRPHLPETVPLEWKALLGRLRREGRAFLKPDAGTHGKGAAAATMAASGTIEVKCRTDDNAERTVRFDSLKLFYGWLQSFVRGKRYLLQQFLQLADETGAVCDLRALMQKNGRGRWGLTGIAARIGGPGSITSNLHGGGAAEAAHSFLVRRFGREAANRLLAEADRLAAHIPPVLESRYGRLAELGIDLGIDADRRLWIIEVNSKPGRTAFAQLSGGRAYTLAVRKPLAYARYLLENALLPGAHPSLSHPGPLLLKPDCSAKRLGGSFDEFDPLLHSRHPAD